MWIWINPCLTLRGRVPLQVIRTPKPNQFFCENPPIESVEHHLLDLVYIAELDDDALVSDASETA